MRQSRLCKRLKSSKSKVYTVDSTEFQDAVALQIDFTTFSQQQSTIFEISNIQKLNDKKQASWKKGEAEVLHFLSCSNVKIWRQVAARKLEIQDFLRAEMDLKQKNSGFHLRRRDSNRRMVDFIRKKI